jgi:hypothetical protein
VVANAELLSSVEILAGATVLRDYFLGYQSSPATGREELISLKECADAAQTNCLLPSSVSYAAPTSGVTTTPATALTSSGLFQLSARYDLNGDGIPDLVYFNGTSWFVAFGSTAGYGTPINTGIGVVSHVLIGNSSRIMPTYWRAGIAAAVLSIVVAVCLLSNAPPGRLLQFASPTTPNADKEDGKADDRAASLPHRLPARYANAGSESYASGALANQSRIDSSVIGRPFALSASMQAELNKSDAFRPARERLVQMARESREIEWANSEEQKIQDLLTSDELVVRNIECRASICAVEVASAGENFDVVRIEQQLIRLNVWGPEYLTFSKDIDDDGNNVKEALFEIRRL